MVNQQFNCLRLLDEELKRAEKNLKDERGKSKIFKYMDKKAKSDEN